MLGLRDFVFTSFSSKLAFGLVGPEIQSNTRLIHQSDELYSYVTAFPLYALSSNQYNNINNSSVDIISPAHFLILVGCWKGIDINISFFRKSYFHVKCGLMC